MVSDKTQFFDSDDESFVQDDNHLEDLAQANAALSDFPDDEEAPESVLKQIEQMEWARLSNKDELDGLARLNGHRTYRSWQRFWHLGLRKARRDKFLSRFRD
jgi:hypothetical protein